MTAFSSKRSFVPAVGVMLLAVISIVAFAARGGSTDQTALENALEAVVVHAESQPGVKQASGELAPSREDGTFVMTVTLGDTTAEQRKALLSEIMNSVRAIHVEDGRLKVLELTLSDAAGPVLTTTKDFESDAQTNWWRSDEYIPPWVSAPLALQADDLGGTHRSRGES